MNWVESFLCEDVGQGDITTLALVGSETGTARIKTNEACVLAGLDEAIEIFRHLGIQAVPLAEDGDTVAAEASVLSIEGPLRAILTGERLALNMLMRMSGIATITQGIVHACRQRNPASLVAATRKTTPGFRKFEKKAVALGGGDPHRYGLDDAILIKDNHIAVVGSITESVKRAKKVSFTKKVEIEVEDLGGAEEAAKAGADIILLDNMSPEEARRCTEAVRRVNDRIIVEASGGITPENAPDYAEVVDVVSLGWITHSARAVHFSLNVLEVRY
ncbi:MAG: carboxylating nicotinate-nucleotide diphosphorylase [Euryarchaeota archaeon]|nr:carboxylating nicotinate-nucleotide diphosphorylase [Euryarchaeota archaeon]